MQTSELVGKVKSVLDSANFDHFTEDMFDEVLGEMSEDLEDDDWQELIECAKVAVFALALNDSRFDHWRSEN